MQRGVASQAQQFLVLPQTARHRRRLCADQLIFRIDLTRDALVKDRHRSHGLCELVNELVSLRVGGLHVPPLKSSRQVSHDRYYVIRNTQGILLKSE